MKKIPLPTPEELWRLYCETGSVHRLAKKFNTCGETVRARLKKAGYQLKGAKFTPEEDTLIRDYYTLTSPDQFDLGSLAEKIKRPKPNVCRRARELNLTNPHRAHSAKVVENQKLATKAWFEVNPHPLRGLKLGPYSPEANKKSGEGVRRAWARARATGTIWLSPASLQKKSDHMMKMQRENPAMRQGYSRGKQGKRDDLGGLYVRSAWEANYARYLNFLIGLGQIKKWEYEADTFWFETIKRGTRSYTPDFKVWENDDRIIYHEVKGWMDEKSITRLKRMAKFHPNVRLIVIAKAEMAEIKSKVGRLIPFWE